MPFGKARSLNDIKMNMNPTGEYLVMQMKDANMAFLTEEEQGMATEEKEFNRPKGHGELILAIEDDELLRGFLQTILGYNGYKVILAGDGTEGLRTYLERMNEIDLVLLDMGLPKMSGKEVLSSIVGSNPNARVIAVSGSFEPSVQVSTFQIGTVGYLPKPYLTEELLQKVDHALQAEVQATR